MLKKFERQWFWSIISFIGPSVWLGKILNKLSGIRYPSSSNSRSWCNLGDIWNLRSCLVFQSPLWLTFSFALYLVFKHYYSSKETWISRVLCLWAWQVCTFAQNTMPLTFKTHCWAERGEEKNKVHKHFKKLKKISTCCFLIYCSLQPKFDVAFGNRPLVC